MKLLVNDKCPLFDPLMRKRVAAVIAYIGGFHP